VRYVAASVDEIPLGGRKIVEVGGQSVGIFNLDGEFFALRNRCPHQGGPLCEGRLWGILDARLPGEFEYTPRREILTCPWHGWEFHLRTGQSWCDPRRLRTRRYAVTVEAGGAILAGPSAPAPGLMKGPYTVEQFQVSTEGRYVVVEIPGARVSFPQVSANGSP
jgi:nitrite reductase/ring-hydroxylating ferredoxin subunit